MSAAVLREAAALMRERAEAATEAPWRCDPEQERPTRPVDCYDVIDSFTLPVVASVVHADATHIASWHPAVALAVADWLEASICGCDSACAPPLALAVARTYLGVDQ